MPTHPGVKYAVLPLLAIIGFLLAGGQASASPAAKVYQFKDPNAFSIGGLRVGMSMEQARSTLGTPDKTTGQSLYYDQDKKGVSIAIFRDDRLLQIFGKQVEFNHKPARNKDEMQRLLGVPPSLQPDENSSWWYIATPDARLIVVFSSEDGKPYCSLIDRTGKDF